MIDNMQGEEGSIDLYASLFLCAQNVPILIQSNRTNRETTRMTKVLSRKGLTSKKHAE